MPRCSPAPISWPSCRNPRQVPHNQQSKPISIPLILNTVVTGDEVPSVQETQCTQAIVDGHNNGVGGVSQHSAVVERTAAKALLEVTT